MHICVFCHADQHPQKGNEIVAFETQRFARDSRSPGDYEDARREEIEKLQEQERERIEEEQQSEEYWEAKREQKYYESL